MADHAGGGRHSVVNPGTKLWRPPVETTQFWRPFFVRPTKIILIKRPPPLDHSMNIIYWK